MKARLTLVNALFHELSKCKEIVILIVFISSELKVFSIEVGRNRKMRQDIDGVNI